MSVSKNGLRTWVEVDRQAIRQNYQTFRQLTGKRVKLMAVVKSNAYGHGLVGFSKEISNLGIDWLGVDSVVEAFSLRREGIKTPILVLGYTLPENFSKAARADVTLTVSSLEQLEALGRRQGSPQTKIHIKVDTGMHRQGFLEGERSRLLSALKSLQKKIAVQGLYTHFASAERKFMYAQLVLFRSWSEAFRRAGFAPLRHAAATAATLLFPESHLDMVRIGLGLYGLWPSKEVERRFNPGLTLSPALSWKTVVTELKKLPKGERIGYDLTETLKRDSVVAICPVGYWHGYPRSLSRVGKVVVAGRQAKILGRVSMDMIAADVSDIPAARVGSEAALIGRQRGEGVSVEELASHCATSNYEIVTRLNPLIKRIYR